MRMTMLASISVGEIPRITIGGVVLTPRTLAGKVGGLEFFINDRPGREYGEAHAWTICIQTRDDWKEWDAKKGCFESAGEDGDRSMSTEALEEEVPRAEEEILRKGGEW